MKEYKIEYPEYDSDAQEILDILKETYPDIEKAEEAVQELIDNIIDGDCGYEDYDQTSPFDYIVHFRYSEGDQPGGYHIQHKIKIVETPQK